MDEEPESGPGERTWLSPREFSRELRRNATPAERFLWRFLRRRQRLGFRFLRQHPIHRWIVDFYCVRALIAIEVDGSWHRGRRARDLIRDRSLDRMGILVLRLSNEVVLRNIDSALGQIDWVLATRGVRPVHRLSPRRTAGRPRPTRSKACDRSEGSPP
jgi:very-short-patch-repair endonuclease